MTSFARRAFVAALALLPAFAWAQQYPNKPVKIVVAFTAGGTTDILARFLAQNLTDRYKQSFFVENKPGAGGNLGTELVVHSPPDGYTLLVGSVGPIAVNPSLKKLTYDPLKDLVAVGQIADVANVMVVHPDINVKSLKEFVAWAKKKGDVNYASTGVGTSSHLSGYMLSKEAGITAQHIPYKGAEALKDMLAGRTQFMFATIPSVISHLRAGKLVAIAVSTPKRSQSLPDVPTVKELGWDVEAGSWFGIFAPKGTPQPIVNELNKALNEFLAEKKIQERLIHEGADPVIVSPKEFHDFVARETDKWRKVVKESGASAN